MKRSPRPNPALFLIPGMDLTGMSRLKSLEQAARHCGWFVGSANSPVPRSVEDQYGDWLHEGSEHQWVVLVGLGFGADHLASHFFDFMRVGMPDAVVLMSTEASLLDLNNLACPYLLIFGEQDARLADAKFYRRMHDAVFHHQMRYGDGTTAVAVPELGSTLAIREGELAPIVVAECLGWIHRSVRTGKRPQEPAGGSAVA